MNKMNSTINLFAKTIVGSLCVSADDGQKLHDSIARLLRDEKSVSVSFEGVETLISAFLNAAIGQLYGEFDERLLQERLVVKGMEAEDFDLLQRVIRNAKVYFENRRSFDAVWRSEANEE